MGIDITFDGAVIVAMRHCFPSRFSDEEIASFLGVELDYVRNIGNKVERQMIEIVSLRVGNRKSYMKREKIAQLVMEKGGALSVRELREIGISPEDLLEEPAVFGCGEDDEHYEKRFQSNSGSGLDNAGSEGDGGRRDPSSGSMPDQTMQAEVSEYLSGRGGGLPKSKAS